MELKRILDVDSLCINQRKLAIIFIMLNWRNANKLPISLTWILYWSLICEPIFFQHFDSLPSLSLLNTQEKFLQRCSIARLPTYPKGSTLSLSFQLVSSVSSSLWDPGPLREGGRTLVLSIQRLSFWYSRAVIPILEILVTNQKLGSKIKVILLFLMIEEEGGDLTFSFTNCDGENFSSSSFLPNNWLSPSFQSQERAKLVRMKSTNNKRVWRGEKEKK